MSSTCPVKEPLAFSLRIGIKFRQNVCDKTGNEGGLRIALPQARIDIKELGAFAVTREYDLFGLQVFLEEGIFFEQMMRPQYVFQHVQFVGPSGPC